MGIYPIPLPAGYFSASSSLGGLSVFWQFVVPLYCGGSSIKDKKPLLVPCGVGQVACQGFLVREVCVGILVGRSGFLLFGVQ